MAVYVFYPALFDAAVSNVKKHYRIWKGHAYQEPPRKASKTTEVSPHAPPEACQMNEPGGKCSGVPTGAGDCTWNYQNAGELQLTVSQLGYAVDVECLCSW